jgi:Lrp/AsnC family transcriptional regulator for asnA, asnC and gidA
MRFKSTFFLNDNYSKTYRDDFLFIGKKRISGIDQLDMKILHEISSNATISLLQLGKIFGLTAVGINYRIKKLFERKVILGFKVDINLSELGYQKFKIYLNLRNYNKRNEIINFVKVNQYLLNIDTNSGESDIELEFVVKSHTQIQEILCDLTDEFSNEIKHYNIITDIELFKYNYFPECY